MKIKFFAPVISVGLFLMSSNSLALTVGSQNEEQTILEKRKCIYHAFFYKLRTGSKRALNDLVFYLPEASETFFNAIINASIKDNPNLEPSTPEQIKSIEDNLESKFSMDPALDNMTDYLRFVTEKEVPECSSKLIDNSIS